MPAPRLQLCFWSQRAHLACKLCPISLHISADLLCVRLPSSDDINAIISEVKEAVATVLGAYYLDIDFTGTSLSALCSAAVQATS